MQNDVITIKLKGREWPDCETTGGFSETVKHIYWLINLCCCLSYSRKLLLYGAYVLSLPVKHCLFHYTKNDYSPVSNH